MAVVTSFSYDQDFWELNPQLLLDPAIKALHKADKSKDKEKSSTMMWWVALCYDMDKDNKWRGGVLEDKQEILGEELVGEKSFYRRNRKELDPVIAAYIKFTDTAPKRQYRSLVQKLDEKTEHMNSMHYRDDPSGIDKMLESNEKHYKMLATIEKQLSEETGEGQGKGGSAPSLSDTGEI